MHYQRDLPADAPQEVIDATGVTNLWPCGRNTLGKCPSIDWRSQPGT